MHLNPADKAWWLRELDRVAEVDGLGGRPNMAVLLHRIAILDLKLDERSLQRIARLMAEDEPAEFTHKPSKRAAVGARI